MILPSCSLLLMGALSIPSGTDGISIGTVSRLARKIALDASDEVFQTSGEGETRRVLAQSSGKRRFGKDDISGFCQMCGLQAVGVVPDSCWQYAKVACMDGALNRPPGYSDQIDTPEYCGDVCDLEPGADEDEVLLCANKIKAQHDSWCTEDGKTIDSGLCELVMIDHNPNVFQLDTKCDEPDPDGGLICDEECATEYVGSALALDEAGCIDDVVDCRESADECYTEGNEVCTEDEGYCRVSCALDSDCDSANGEICREGTCWTALEYFMKGSYLQDEFDVDPAGAMALTCSVNEEGELCTEIITKAEKTDGIDETRKIWENAGCCVRYVAELNPDGPLIKQYRGDMPKIDWDTTMTACKEATFSSQHDDKAEILGATAVAAITGAGLVAMAAVAAVVRRYKVQRWLERTRLEDEDGRPSSR